MAEKQQMETLLAGIREALRDGNYAKLHALAPALERGISEIGSLDEIRLEAVQHEARRAAGSAMAALQGIRAGQRRIAELMRLEAGFLSYGAIDGQMTVLHHPGLSRQF